MRTATKHKRRGNQTAKQSGKNSIESQKLEKGLSTRRFRRTNGGNTIVPSTRNDGPNFLTLKTKNVFEVAVTHHYSLGKIDIETVIDIYKCLKNIPEFKDKEDWSSNASFAEVANWVFSQIKHYIPTEFDWVIDSEDNAITYFKAYHEHEGFNNICLEWLPEYRNENFALWEIIVDTIAALIKKNGIQCASYYEELVVNDIEVFDEEDEMFDFFELDRIKYRNGIKYSYDQMFYRKGDVNSISAVINSIEEFKAKTPKQRQIINWLKLSIPILKADFKIYDYSFNYEDPENQNGDVLKPEEYFCFEWSWYDMVAQQIEDFRNSIANEMGTVSPTVSGFYTQKAHVQPKPIENIVNLSKFMTAGRKIFDMYYRKKIENRYDKRAQN